MIPNMTSDASSSVGLWWEQSESFDGHIYIQHFGVILRFGPSEWFGLWYMKADKCKCPLFTKAQRQHLIVLVAIKQATWNNNLYYCPACVCVFPLICWSSASMTGLGVRVPSFPLSPQPDTKMKDEMEIVTDAITALLIEGEAKLSAAWLGFVWSESMPRSD